MKKSIILIGCMVLGLATSCYKSQLDPLTGKFPAPTRVENVTSATATAELLDSYHLFTLDLKDGGNAFHLVLAGEKYYLPANIYIEADESAARKGNFILGKTTVNGAAVKTGKITVGYTPVDETHHAYDIAAVLFLNDGTPYTLKWNGVFEFEPDPILGDIVVENYLTVTSAQTEAGTTQYTLKITDPDGADAGFFELYVPAAATGFTGSFSCIEYAQNNADGYVVSNGWSFPDWGMAGGSHYFKDGSQVDVQPGQTVRVAALSATAYAISIDDQDVVVAGTTAGEAIVVGNTGVDVISSTEAGTTLHTVTVTDADGAEAAFFELYVPAAATGFTGSFSCIEYAQNNADGYVVSNGWSFPDWGMAGGSHYFVDGVQTDLPAGAVVDVVKIGGNWYSFAVAAGPSYLVKIN